MLDRKIMESQNGMLDNRSEFDDLNKILISPQKSKQIIVKTLLNVSFAIRINPAAKMTFTFSKVCQTR